MFHQGKVHDPPLPVLALLSFGMPTCPVRFPAVTSVATSPGVHGGILFPVSPSAFRTTAYSHTEHLPLPNYLAIPSTASTDAQRGFVPPGHRELEPTRAQSPPRALKPPPCRTACLLSHVHTNFSLRMRRTDKHTYRSTSFLLGRRKYNPGASPVSLTAGCQPGASTCGAESQVRAPLGGGSLTQAHAGGGGGGRAARYPSDIKPPPAAAATTAATAAGLAAGVVRVHGGCRGRPSPGPPKRPPPVPPSPPSPGYTIQATVL